MKYEVNMPIFDVNCEVDNFCLIMQWSGTVRSSFVYKMKFFVHHSRLFLSGNIYYVLNDFNLLGISGNEEFRIFRNMKIVEKIGFLNLCVC